MDEGRREVTAPADRDPDVQGAVDDEVRRLAHAVAAIAPLAAPHLWARGHVEGMYGRGWRPWPRSDKIPQPGAKDPATAHRGADLARKALQGDTDEA